MKQRPKILSIAGFDPSSGAGLTADLKTFEAHKCYGMAVQTANTIQTEHEFISPNWIDENVIFDQLDLLLKHNEFAVVKIGLIPSFDFLIDAIKRIRNKNANAVIIWDPVLSTSTNFKFNHANNALNDLLDLVDWITPNWNEIQELTGNSDALEGAKILSAKAKVYLKGGHNKNQPGKDYLYENGQSLSFNPRLLSLVGKHGSGCVFSSALASNIALGYPVQKSVLRAKRYIEQFLKSNSTLLGLHK